jgi:cell wall-associated NlpC family hydrolase
LSYTPGRGGAFPMLYSAPMHPRSLLATLCVAGLLVLPQARALDMPAEAMPEAMLANAFDAKGASDRTQQVISRALGLVGIQYRAGGSSAETGFDCSGFVGYVFREVMGLVLPRTSYDMVKKGVPVAKDELRPGDLVFFHTMQHAFSHVGIYLGDHRFVHSPSTGKKVRVEDMRTSYWVTRYNGARRLEKD